jgi:hypothetical protein
MTSTPSALGGEHGRLGPGVRGGWDRREALDQPGTDLLWVEGEDVSACMHRRRFTGLLGACVSIIIARCFLEATSILLGLLRLQFARTDKTGCEGISMILRPL